MLTANPDVLQKAYAREYVRLSLLGVYGINNLVECSKVLPQATTGSFNPPDQSYVDMWMQTTAQTPSVAQALMNGDLLSSLLETLISTLLGLLRKS